MRHVKPFFALGMIFVLLTGCLSTALGRETTYTCGEAAQRLEWMADDYVGLNERRLLGDFSAATTLTCANACEMLLRAFGPLPAPQGAQRWQGQHLSAEKLIDATAPMLEVHATGILTEEFFRANEALTEAQFTLLVKRLYAYLGSQPQDDFYAAQNNAFVRADDSVTDAETYDFMPFRSVTGIAAEQLYAWVEQTVERLVTQGATDTAEQAVLAAYTLIADMDARNAQGISPLAPWLSALKDVETPEQLTSLWVRLAQELGVACGPQAFIIRDEQNYERRLTALSGFPAELDPAVYEDREGYPWQAEVEQTQGKLLVLDMPADKETAEAYCAFRIESYRKRVQALSDPQYRELSVTEAQAYLPAIDLAAYLRALGVEKPDVVLYANPRLLSALQDMLTTEDIVAWKCDTALQILSHYALYLTPHTVDKNLGIWGDYFAAMPEALLYGDFLTEALLRLAPREMADLYMREHALPTVTAQLPALYETLKETLKTRLIQADVLSDGVLESALAKIDAYQLVYRFETWQSECATLPPFTPADSLFKAVRTAFVWQLHDCSTNDSEYFLPAYDLPNGLFSGLCLNHSQARKLVFTPTYLSWPFVYDGMTMEQLYGGLGFILAHELSHCVSCEEFLQFDAQGNDNPTEWSEQDKAYFTRLNAALHSWYAGREVLPGITQDPSETQIENLTDLTAMRILTDCLPNTLDRRAFFEAFARSFPFSGTDKSTRDLAVYDTHSNGGARINAVLSACDLFYETYAIDRTDGMYAPPEDRPVIWEAE